MTSKKYTFEVADVEVPVGMGIDEPTARDLCRELFLASGLGGSHSGPAPTTPLSARMLRRTEGRSGAEVLDVAFRESSESWPVAQYIVRIHTGGDAARDAELERSIAKTLSSAGLDYFSSSILEGDFGVQNAVVYRHAGTELGSEVVTLRDNVLKSLESLEPALAELPTAASEMLEAVERAYDQHAGEHIIVDSSSYFRGLRNRLAPDIVVDLRGWKLRWDGDSGRVSCQVMRADGSGVGDPASVLPVDLLDAAGERTLDAWCSASLTALDRQRDRSYRMFRAGGQLVWLYTDPEYQVSLQSAAHMSLVFHLSDDVVRATASLLSAPGMDAAGSLTVADFEGLCGLYPELRLALRHTDLHSENLMVAGTRLKVIDISSMDYDLPSVCRARLEASLWADVGGEDAIDQEDARLVAHAIEKCVPDDLHLSDAGRRFTALLRAVGCAQPDGPEAVMARLVQALLQQRYLLEAEVAAVPEQQRQYFALVAGAVRSLTSGDADGGASAEPAEAETGRPTLGALWHAALGSPITGMPTARCERLLDALGQTNPELMGRPLTDLQLTLFEQSEAFREDGNLILAGPTSSGKSTLAEMFLVRCALVGLRRTKSVYVAPTKALAQAKWRDLRSRLSAFPELAERTLLSTGEDTDGDQRIALGDFSIVCMVNEKANIVFSKNRRLLSEVGCVVVDELHMLKDLHRGPNLEMLMAKVIDEQRRIRLTQSRDQANDVLRVVAISTEDAPSEDLLQFLSSESPLTQLRKPPRSLFAKTRPVPVQHSVVLAGDRDGTEFRVLPLVTFERASDRSLSKERVAELDRHFDAVTQSVTAMTAGWSSMQVSSEHRNRAIHLVRQILVEHPKGHRVLVFVPSRGMALELGRQMKNELIRTFGGDRKMAPEDITALREKLDRAEDQRTAQSLLELAQRGVFVHHADVDREVRTALEQDWGSSQPESISQVMFATETLSYGVNLAVNDVVLVGVEFQTSTRLLDRRTDYLDACSFHNMVGRAGRLGKVVGDTTSSVYLVLPADVEDPLHQIVSRYYERVEAIQSELFVRDDAAAPTKYAGSPFRQLDEAHDPFALLGATDFSYPFARSVLDILRYLNLSAGIGQETPATAEDVFDVLALTLFRYEYIDRHEVSTELFMSSVGCILTSCSRPPLSLVRAEEAGLGKPTLYTIEPRGEAIIDTGTEIKTIEPMLEFIDELHDAWAEVGSGNPFPLELYLFAVLAQAEVFRQYIGYTPECRKNAKRWTPALTESNRSAVRERFASELAEVAIGADPSSLADRISGLLDEWDPLRKTKSVYDRGQTDALLRLFCALRLWIKGEPWDRVTETIEGEISDTVQMAEGLRGRMQGLRQFTELVSWKVLFLSKMLATATDARVSFGPEDERALVTLASRLRYGCTENAVLLLWPPVLTRSEASDLLSRGMTPSRILRAGAGTRQGGIGKKKLTSLERNLKKKVALELESLRSQMMASPRADDRRQIQFDYWNNLLGVFRAGVDAYGDGRTAPAGFDQMIRNCVGPDADSSSVEAPAHLTARDRIARSGAPSEVHSEGSLTQEETVVTVARHSSGVGIALTVESGRGQDRRLVSVRCIGLECRRDWTVSAGDSRWSPLDKFLESLEAPGHIVLIPLPWLPPVASVPKAVTDWLRRRRIQGFTTSFMSPAAFGLELSMVTRDFTSGEELRRLLLTDSQEVVLVRHVLPVLDEVAAQVIPGGMRDQLIQFFEVETETLL